LISEPSDADGTGAVGVAEAALAVAVAVVRLAEIIWSFASIVSVSGVMEPSRQ